MNRNEMLEEDGYATPQLTVAGTVTTLTKRKAGSGDPEDDSFTLVWGNGFAQEDDENVYDAPALADVGSVTTLTKRKTGVGDPEDDSFTMIWGNGFVEEEEVA